MAPIPNPRVVFAKVVPQGEAPVPGEHLVYDNSKVIDLDTIELNGGFLTKTLVVSPEPYMRERLRDRSIKSYSTTMVVGAPIVGMSLVKVLRSEKEGIKAGDLMYGMTQWEAYTVQPYLESRQKDFKQEEWAPETFNMDTLELQVVPDPQGAFPLVQYCSILGTPGLSGYVGFEGCADAKEGETIFVSSGASGVGSMVIQLAKIKGLKVIASAGSDEKVEYIRSIGADLAFNYKKTSYDKFLSEHGPIDVFWDNVGGECFEAALDATNVHARIVICGMISEYNVAREKRYGIKNIDLCYKRRLTIRGFLVPDLVPAFGEKFFKEVPAWLAQGKFKSKEIIYDGLDKGPQAFVEMLSGTADDATSGKPVVVLSLD